MDYKELKWNCEARSEVFRTRRNEAGAMNEEQCSRAITDLLARAAAAEARAEKAEKCITEIEEALKFQRYSASMFFISEYRGQKEE